MIFLLASEALATVFGIENENRRIKWQNHCFNDYYHLTCNIACVLYCIPFLLFHGYILARLYFCRQLYSFRSRTHLARRNNHFIAQHHRGRCYQFGTSYFIPSNSVTRGIRLLAEGDLSARAASFNNAQNETNQLIRDFNLLAERLERMTNEQRFWNAAIAHELRTPVTILYGRLQGMLDGVFTPDNHQLRSLLVQVDGLKISWKIYESSV